MPETKIPSINFLNIPGESVSGEASPPKKKRVLAGRRAGKAIKNIKAAAEKKPPRKKAAEAGEKISGRIPILVKKNIDIRPANAEKKEKLSLPEKTKQYPPFRAAVNRPGLYRKIAFIFIILVLVLLGIVFYFSFVRLKIVVVPNQENISDSLTFKVSAAAASAGAESLSDTLGGVVEKFSLNEEIIYPASGEKILSEEMTGQATVYNNYIKNQPLVASTRLLAPDGKLFRIKQTVNVPAGGQMDVEIYADQPEAGMVFPATRFSIPGLWSGLQDKIYAETVKPMEGKKDIVKFVTDEDIAQAINKVKSKLITMAQAASDTKYPQYDAAVFKIDETTVKNEIFAKAGDEKENFRVKVTADVEIVAFSREESIKLIEDKVALAVAAGKEFLNVDGQKINYSLAGETDKSGASVKAEFTAKFALSKESEILDPKDLAGLNRNQLEEYLKGKEEIADYEIKFYPSFVQRVPNLLDRIEIEVIN